jgi:starch synthase (maltosyl-transferring)
VRWEGAFTVDRPGTWEWTIEAWVDAFATWRDEVARKLEAAQQSLAARRRRAPS